MLWSVLLGIVAFILIVCIFCYRKCFYNANHTPRDPYEILHGEQYLAVKEQILASTRVMDEAPFEDVAVTSFDGLRLYGRYYHHRDGAPVMLVFHGYRSMALRDSTGGFYLGRKLGFNILAVDQRAHGKSEGHVITFGILERQDCLSWVTYISQRFGADTPIVLSGLSMGAATVVMATALPLPSNVICVLADCPYSSPKEIICKVCEDERFPARAAYPFIKLAARVFGGFDLEAASAVNAAGESKIPILLLHGDDDRFVPCEMSRKIHDSSNGCTSIEIFPDAGHGLSYTLWPKRYEQVCFDFLMQFPVLTKHICAENFRA